MMSIWAAGFANGDLNRLLGNMAYDGTVCGINNDDDLGYWPHPKTVDFRMCTSTCNITANMKYIPPSPYIPMHEFLPFGGDIWPIFPYPSSPKYGLCIPDAVKKSEGDFAEKYKMNKFIADLYDGLWVIGVSAGVGLIMSFIYLKFVEKCAGCLIWGTLAITILCGACIGYFLLMDGLSKGEEGAISTYTGYGFLGATALWLLILIFLRNRIRIAVQVMKSATRAITDMKAMLLVPIPMSLAGVVFVIGWIFSMLFLTSVGKFEEVETPRVLSGVTLNGVLLPATYKLLTYDEGMNDTIWANIFFLFWVLNFIIYLLYLTIAGAVADWYFTRRDGRGKKNSRHKSGSAPKVTDLR